MSNQIIIVINWVFRQPFSIAGYIKIYYISCIKDIYTFSRKKDALKSIIIVKWWFLHSFSKAVYIKINYVSCIEDLCTFPLRKCV